MQSTLALVFLVLAASPQASAVEVTPVQKLIQLMSAMLEKGKKERKAEQVQFAAFKQFCDDTETEKTREIQEADELIEKLTADIADYKSQINSLSTDISALDKNIATWEGDMKAAKIVWQMDSDRFADKKKDLAESNYALDNAIQRAGATMTKTVPQFLQLHGIDVSSFEQLGDEDLQTPSAYSGHSGGILETLENLANKFKQQATETQREEDNTKHAFDMLVQELTAELEQANADRTQKMKFRSNKMQEMATAKSDLQDTTATRKEDSKYLADTKATCNQKASAFEKRQQLRKEEIEAIDKALEIFKSGAVAGHADKHLPALIQKNTALVQIKSDTQNEQREKVLAYLKNQAVLLNSRELTQLVAKAAADPFEKVKQMIRDMIAKLMEEAGEEAQHKMWCDQELGSNEQTRKEKTDSVEVLTSEIDQLAASIAKLGEDVEELTAAVGHLDKAMEEATDLRQQEKAKNAETISDAQEAQVAVAKATTVLKEFYKKAGEATAFVQQKQPEIFDEEYTGMQSENGGVMGMIEVIASDFARLEAETTAGEASAQREFDNFMTDSREDKKIKERTIDDKSAKKTDQIEIRSEKRVDLEGTQKELDAAMRYYNKLKPDCIEVPVSYEDRVAARKAEIESLQEALKILKQ